jgi:hypothetical protein
MHSMSLPASTDQRTTEPGGHEAQVLRQQIQQGDFSGLRRLLASTKEKHDWQDRYFMLDVVAPAIPPGSLDAACAAEPSATDLFLMRGCHWFDLVWKSRGTKTADHTTQDQFNSANEYLQVAMSDLRQASELDPADPVPYVFAMRGLQIFSEYEQVVKNAYQAAIRLVPDFLPAHWTMVNARSKKWAGSHEESLDVARSAASLATAGGDLAGCLFFARILAWQYLRIFDKDPRAAEQYLSNREINNELNAAFEEWTRPPYQSVRSSVPYLSHAAFWFYQRNDRERLARAFSHIHGVFCDRAWSFTGNALQTYTAALELAAKKRSVLAWFKS